MKLKRVVGLFGVALGLVWLPAGVWGLAPESAVSLEGMPRYFDATPFFEKTPSHLDALLPEKEYVVFDFETTSLNTEKAKPIEIAALKFRGTRLVGEFYMLVDPGEPIEPEATRVNKITDAMVHGKTPVPEAIRQFSDFVGEAELVGHNIAPYDVPIFKNRLKTIFPPRRGNPFLLHDTKVLAKLLIPRHRLRGAKKHYKLENLVQDAGAPRLQFHGAFSDAVMNTFVFWHLKELEERQRQLFLRQLRENETATLRHLQTVFDFLQGGEADLSALPPAALLVLLGSGKLEGVAEAARLYSEGKAKKVMVIAYGQEQTPEGLVRVVELYRRLLRKNGILEADLELKEIPYQTPRRMDAIGEAATSGNLLFLDEPYYLRSFLNIIEKRKREKIFPEGVRVWGVPAPRLDAREMSANPEALFQASLKAVLGIEALEFYSRRGDLLLVDFPGELRLAVRFLGPCRSLEESI